MGTHDTSFLTVVVVLAGVAGLVVGSFLNVVVYWCPSGSPSQSRGRPAPIATANFPGWENVPLISWIVLRGVAGSASFLSLRYPAVELATGSVFALVAGPGVAPSRSRLLLFGRGR